MRISGGFSHPLGYYSYGKQETLRIWPLRPCRQLYDEAASLPHNLTTLIFGIEEMVKKFLTIIAHTEAGDWKAGLRYRAHPKSLLSLTEWEIQGKRLRYLGPV